MRVRVIESAAELERSADGFGGWNPAMASCCGKIGVVENTNGTWVSVGFGTRSWALNPAVLTRVEDDAEADGIGSDDSDDEGDVLRMLFGGGGAPRRARRAEGGGATPGRLSVGDRVRLRPGAEQRGCLAHDRVGTLVDVRLCVLPQKIHT